MILSQVFLRRISAFGKIILKEEKEEEREKVFE